MIHFLKVSEENFIALPSGRTKVSWDFSNPNTWCRSSVWRARWVSAPRWSRRFFATPGARFTRRMCYRPVQVNQIDTGASMFFIYGTTGRTFSGTLESFLPLSGIVKACNARKSGNGLLDADGPIHEIGRESETPRIEHGKFAQAAQAYDKMHRRENKRTPVCHAYQIMSQDILTLNPTDTVGSAWLKLAERKVRQSPVLGPTKEVVGLVSDRDLLMVANLEGNLLSGLLNRPISELMVTPVACSAPVTDIRRISRVMLATGLSAVPIVDDGGQLLGIVSRGDILRAIVNDPPLSLWV